MTDLLYQKIATYEGEEKALEVAREGVHARPSLSGVYRLIEAQMDELSPEGRMDAEVARALVLKHAQRLSVHRCKCCNFRSRAFSGIARPAASGKASPPTARNRSNKTWLKIKQPP